MKRTHNDLDAHRAVPLQNLLQGRGPASTLTFFLALLFVGLFAQALAQPAHAGDNVIQMMAVAGVLKETTTPDEHLVRDVSDAITYQDESDQVPLDQLMRRGRRRKPAGNKIIEWERRDRTPPRRDLVNGTQTAGTTGLTKTVPVDTALMWRVNDIIMLPNNATAPGALLLVTATNTGGGTIDVVRLPVAATKTTTPAALGQVPALADNEVLVRMTTSKTEADTPSASRIVTPDLLFNFVHAYDALVEVSEHRKRTKNYTSSHDWAINTANSVIDMRRGMEYNSFWGKPTITTGANGELRMTMAGLLHYVSQTIGYSIGNLTESNIVDIGEQVFTGNTGKKNRLLFADKKLCSALDKVQLAKMQNLPTRTMAGVRTTLLETRHGTLAVVHHPGFDELQKTNFGVVVDLSQLYYAELEPLDHEDVDKKKQGTKDSQAKWYQCKHSLEVGNPAAHFIIQGS